MKESFVDYEVVPGTEYSYTVAGVCANGVVGLPSAPIVARTAAGDGTLGRPTAPKFNILDKTGGAVRVGYVELVVALVLETEQHNRMIYRLCHLHHVLAAA